MDYSGSDNKYTLSILVNNKSGVLMRVVSLFSRRGYNIDSLSVGETEDAQRSRITIVVTGDRQIVEQIKRQVEKLVDVIRVKEMTNSGSVRAELILVKVKCDSTTRTSILSVGEIFKAKIIDVTLSSVTFQITGNSDKLESFIEIARPFGIIEMARTGLTALGRGDERLGDISYGDEE